jgi:DNA-binding MarR family transcriptional regulator/predicted GNAT family N-acyltransferase
MASDTVARLRSFNRTVTERVGALETRYLGRDRPLGESRLLWEIGSGVAVRDLRRRLGLDSGYVSRLLRSLEQQGLAVVVEDEADARVRVARLTDRGARERVELDRLSDELAWAILEPLDDAQQAKLAAAAETVERLLRASLVEVAVEDPSTADGRWCLQQYFAELADRFDSGFDPANSITGEDELTPPRGLLLVARLHEKPVGCGGLSHLRDSAPEVKRMWVAQEVRGLGLGRRMLRELERHAAAAGAPTIRLETNRALAEAIQLYRSSGYREVPAFNDEPYAHHWFEKRLGD